MQQVYFFVEGGKKPLDLEHKIKMTTESNRYEILVALKVSNEQKNPQEIIKI